MRKLLSFIAPAVLCFASVAHAQFTVNITVDEQGNGTFTNSTGFNQTLTGYLAPDPGPGGAASALTYSLLNPPGLVSGDVLIADGGTFSDVVRFNESDGTLVFYSNPLDGFDSLADALSPPSSFYSNQITLSEVNGVVVYTPTAGEPGFVAEAGGPVTYTLESDPVATPEPTSLALLGTGVLGAVGAFRRRFKA